MTLCDESTNTRPGRFPVSRVHIEIHRLVHYEEFGDIREAIAREKQIKGWKREKKFALIESQNPTWNDLSVGGAKTQILRFAQNDKPVRLSC